MSHQGFRLHPFQWRFLYGGPVKVSVCRFTFLKKVQHFGTDHPPYRNLHWKGCNLNPWCILLFIMGDNFYIQINCNTFGIGMWGMTNSVSKWRDTFGMTNFISKFEHGDLWPAMLWCVLYGTFPVCLSSSVFGMLQRIVRGGRTRLTFAQITFLVHDQLVHQATPDYMNYDPPPFEHFHVMWQKCK